MISGCFPSSSLKLGGDSVLSERHPHTFSDSLLGPHSSQLLSLGSDGRRGALLHPSETFDCLYLTLASSHEAAKLNLPKLHMSVMASSYSMEQGHLRTPPQALESDRVQHTPSQANVLHSPLRPMRTCLCTWPPAVSSAWDTLPISVWLTCCQCQLRAAYTRKCP